MESKGMHSQSEDHARWRDLVLSIWTPNKMDGLPIDVRVPLRGYILVYADIM